LKLWSELQKLGMKNKKLATQHTFTPYFKKQTMEPLYTWPFMMLLEHS
jgi:hypothetical protein